MPLTVIVTLFLSTDLTSHLLHLYYSGMTLTFKRRSVIVVFTVVQPAPYKISDDRLTLVDSHYYLCEVSLKTGQVRHSR